MDRKKFNSQLGIFIGFLILISFSTGKISPKHTINFYISFISILVIALLSYFFFYYKRLIN